MDRIDEIKKEIKSLKGKIDRLNKKNKALATESEQLRSIPAEKRTTLIDLRIGEIKLDIGNNNIYKFEYEQSLKELEKELEKEQSQAQPS